MFSVFADRAGVAHERCRNTLSGVALGCLGRIGTERIVLKTFYRTFYFSVLYSNLLSF